MVADEPERAQDFDCEQVYCRDSPPMCLDEAAPGHTLAPFGRRHDTVVCEDPTDGVASEKATKPSLAKRIPFSTQYKFRAASYGRRANLLNIFTVNLPNDVSG
jgi:hypothetical protein